MDAEAMGYRNMADDGLHAAENGPISLRKFNTDRANVNALLCIAVVLDDMSDRIETMLDAIATGAK